MTRCTESKYMMAMLAAKQARNALEAALQTLRAELEHLRACNVELMEKLRLSEAARAGHWV